MYIPKEGINFRESEVDFDSLAYKLRTGKSVLFIGAGFSAGAVNVSGKNPMQGKKLSHKLCELSGISNSDNLRFSSEYFLSKKPKSSLVKLLLDEYTIKETSSEQNFIAGLPWKRCYTTNYDLSFELACSQSNKNSQTIDLDFETKEYYKQGELCIHLNGSINHLNESTLNESFKLSDASYCSPTSFLNSEWFYYFKKDLEFSNAIIFIGYSLYDIEIKSILHQSPELKDKTYFITGPDMDIESDFTLRQYGTVIPIGIEGFVSKLKLQRCNTLLDDSYIFNSLNEYHLQQSHSAVRDDQVEKMLMYGDVDDSFIDDFIIGHSQRPFLSLRRHIEDVKKLVSNGNNIVIFSALGNGKTIFLKQIRSTLATMSYMVYEIDDPDGDYIEDIDHLGKRSERIVILLDGYEKYLNIIQHLSNSDYENITLVATARIADHEYHRLELDKYGFKYHDLNVDNFSDVELSDFVYIVDNLGLWGEKAGLTHNQKIRLLQGNNDGQMSVILLSLMNSPQIKEKIKNLVDGIRNNKDYESTLIATCLCQVLGLIGTKSIISELSGNDIIYNSDFLNNKGFRILFNMKDGRITSNSSLLGIYLIKNNFSPSVIRFNLIRIASKFNKISNRNHEQDRIFKSMLKFSFVEQLLPENMKVANLQRYYEDLKIEVPWLTNNPHFWLQYAMCYIAFKKFTRAQQYLDQAYALAVNKTNYHTNNIDTQQAKLFLLSAGQISDGGIVYSNFVRANNLLRHLNTDIYMLRQVVRYKDFYEENYNKLSKENKRNFTRSCKEMLVKIERQHEENSVSRFHFELAVKVLNDITSINS
ncbi:SIR2 family protein [Serratia marcescens]|uniref:SIR2 family protein n=1 Tax=Serratia marcescens TaxID=615 RepID=UPI001480D22B|nr:SIR2 family protein [Serratia marcescens]